MLGLRFSRRKILFGGFLALFLIIFGTVLVPSGETWAENKEGDYFTIKVTKYVTENIAKSDGSGEYENTRTEGPETVTIKYIEEDGGNPSFAVNNGTEATILGDNGDDFKFWRVNATTESWTYEDHIKTHIESMPLRLNVRKNYCIVGCKNQVMSVNWPSDNSFETFRNAVKDKIDEEANTNGFWAENGKHKWEFEISDVISSNNEANSGDNTATTQSVNTNSDTDCMSSGQAGTLAWIVCPAIDLMGNAAEDIYKNVIEPALQISPKLFTNSGDDTKNAWETFRNIANSLLIILLLVVIFSQLTGVGIDNYGIKKILPKLIVAAVLMNLSYWICVALVDLSNIFGNSIQGLFDGLGKSLSYSGEYQENIGVDFGANVLVAGAIAGAAITMIANPAVVVTALISVASALVSAIFLFILLSVRQAGIVILTVLSPLAIACMMIPNTKSLYDKWWKIFKSLLMVYPITGLLVGGGNYVAKLLLSTGFAGSSWANGLTAMIAGIVPVFFIPTVLKQSMAAMGNIGASLSGMGQRARGWSHNKMTNSDLNKSLQEQGAMRRMRKKAGYNSKGDLTARGERKAKRATSRIGRLLGSDKRLAAYQNTAKKNMAAEEEANAILTNSLARSGIAASGGDPIDYYNDQFVKAAQRGDTTGMNAALAAAVSSGYLKEKDIAKMVRNAENNGQIKFKNDSSRASWMRDTAAKYGGGFLSTDAELRSFMQKGGDGTPNNHGLGNYGEYAGDGGMSIDDLKPEDVTKLSGDSLAGMAAAGILTQGMAQRVLSSNPNISEDKKIMLSAVANGTNVTDAGRFKEEANALMGNHGATGVMDANGTATPLTQITGTNAATIDSWVSSTPQDVNVANNVLNVRETLYQDPQGNVYEVRRTPDGRHVDGNGFDVQIDPNGKNGLKQA